MTKHTSKFDVVHHMRNVMLARTKRTLPLVATSGSHSASHPLHDAPHHAARRSCQKTLMQAIKLFYIDKKGFC